MPPGVNIGNQSLVSHLVSIIAITVHKQSINQPTNQPSIQWEDKSLIQQVRLKSSTNLVLFPLVQFANQSCFLSQTASWDMQYTGYEFGSYVSGRLCGNHHRYLHVCTDDLRTGIIWKQQRNRGIQQTIEHAANKWVLFLYQHLLNCHWEGINVATPMSTIAIQMKHKFLSVSNTNLKQSILR